MRLMIVAAGLAALAAAVRDAFVRIAEDLHLQYALGFAQTEFDGKRHDMRVRANRPDVSVRARQNFIAAKRP